MLFTESWRRRRNPYLRRIQELLSRDIDESQVGAMTHNIFAELPLFLQLLLQCCQISANVLLLLILASFSCVQPGAEFLVVFGKLLYLVHGRVQLGLTVLWLVADDAIAWSDLALEAAQLGLAWLVDLARVLLQETLDVLDRFQNGLLVVFDVIVKNLERKFIVECVSFPLFIVRTLIPLADTQI